MFMYRKNGCRNKLFCPYSTVVVRALRKGEVLCSIHSGGNGFCLCISGRGAFPAATSRFDTLLLLNYAVGIRWSLRTSQLLPC